ncbi:MAG: hypothetical protein OEV64_15755 [Desulfobulbaceae bacterium]|nr:hypothetical protein [Desulfobulbaceae bacterium]
MNITESISRFFSLRTVSLLFFALCLYAFASTLQQGFKRDNGSNLHLNQAKAWLHGQLDIPKKLHDVAVYKGKYYVPFPPAPSVLLTPVVALFPKVNTTLIAGLLTLLNIFILQDIFIKLEVDILTTRWLVCAFLLGTGYWSTVRLSNGVWFFSHVVAFSALLLAVREALGKGRGLFVGLFAGTAILSRQLCLYSCVFLLIALRLNTSHVSSRCKYKNLIQFCVMVAGALGSYQILNYLRFGNPFDTGYSYLELDGFLDERFRHFGLFNVEYLRFNLYYMFLQGPHFEFGNSLSPRAMDEFGTALTFASPFLFGAFFARENKTLQAGVWISTALALVHMMFYYNNGCIQYNTQRFSLDFIPLLTIPLALSARRINQKILYLSISYSVLLNWLALSLVRR